MPQNAQIDALAAMAQRIYGEIGRTLQLGGSAAAAIRAFRPACSSHPRRPEPDWRQCHTDREYAEVDSMVPRLYLLTRMVMELGRKP